MCGYVRSLLHGVICITKCQRRSNCFSYGFCFFLLSTFGKIVRKFSRETADGISMKLHMYAHGWIAGNFCKILSTFTNDLDFQGHDPVNSHFGSYLSYC